MHCYAIMELLTQRLSLCAAILILICCKNCVTGQLTLSPVAVAPVCHIGDPLQLTCTASAQTIRWSIFCVINDQGTLSEITNSVLIDNRDADQQKTKEVASITFTYARISDQGASPLVSTLSIDSISIGLNGTVVRCSDVANPMTSASTTIYISAANSTVTLYQYTPSLHISEEYDVDNVTVTVEWTQQVQAGDPISYSVSVSPPVPIVYNRNTNLNLVLEYNSEYDLSVETITPCRDNITASIRLQYANCGRPELSSNCGYSRSVPKVLSDDNLPIEGSTVTFSCPPGLVLTGPSSATCTGNGEWEPDPSGLMCEDIPICSYPFSSTANGSTILLIGYLDPAMEGAIVTLECPCEYILIGSNTSTCMGNGKWEPDPREVECTEIHKPPMEESACLQMDVPVYIIAVVSSFSAVVILVISITFFVIGFACGHCHGKGKCCSQTDNPCNVPVYEDVLPRVHDEAHQKQGFKLRENVAYLSSKSMITELNQ